ncbi:MAG: hypothetical protein ABEJ03_05575 [Candidatus Nanohaloarchaea archaeon]
MELFEDTEIGLESEEIVKNLQIALTLVFTLILGFEIGITVGNEGGSSPDHLLMVSTVTYAALMGALSEKRNTC